MHTNSRPSPRGTALTASPLNKGPCSQPPYWTRGCVPRPRWTALAGTMPRAVKAPNSVKLLLLMLLLLLLLGWPWPCLVAW